MDKILIDINIPTPELYTSYLLGSKSTTGPPAAPLMVEVQMNGSYGSIDAQNSSER